MKIDNARLAIAGFSGGMAIIMGAFGAHGLENIMPEHYLKVFNTGVEYQVYHSLALLALAVAPVETAAQKRLKRAFTSWLIDMILFSGSLYLLAFTQINRFGMITPFGGVAFIIGWLFLIPWLPEPSKPSAIG